MQNQEQILRTEIIQTIQNVRADLEGLLSEDTTFYEAIRLERPPSLDDPARGTSLHAQADAVRASTDQHLGTMEEEFRGEWWETGEKEDRRHHLVSAGSLLSVIRSDLDALEAAVREAFPQQTPDAEEDPSDAGTPQTGAQSVITGFFKKLKNLIRPKLKAISSRLWALLSNLLTPKEWTISGDTGVSLLGLQGSVGLSITFGP